MKVYGIKNCNTVKSALNWLTQNGIVFEFHDYKSKGISETKLAEWSKQVGWENLVNKRGTTWRRLDERVQTGVTDATSAIALMKDKTSVIKRPLIEIDDRVVHLGFDETAYQKLL